MLGLGVAAAGSAATGARQPVAALTRPTACDQVAPRFGAWLVAAWLAGIIVNLLTFPGFFDIALRDFGLLIGAVALARLATYYASGWRTS